LVLDLEGVLEDLEPRCLGGESEVETLREQIFELELSLESVTAWVLGSLESRSLDDKSHEQVIGALVRAKEAIGASIVRRSKPLSLEVPDGFPVKDLSLLLARADAVWVPSKKAVRESLLFDPAP
jgi:hypothetical protein